MRLADLSRTYRGRNLAETVRTKRSGPATPRERTAPVAWRRCRARGRAARCWSSASGRRSSSRSRSRSFFSRPHGSAPGCSRRALLRIAGVGLFALGACVALAPLVRLRWPAARDIAARLDRDSGRPPSRDLARRQPRQRRRPRRRARLWAAHQARLARDGRGDSRRPARARAWPSATPMRCASASRCSLSRRRSSAGPELYGRFAAAFDWRGGDAALAAAASRIDAWIDPPALRRPAAAGDRRQAAGAPQTLTASRRFGPRRARRAGRRRDARRGGDRPGGGQAESRAARTRRRNGAGRSMGDGKATILRGGSHGGRRRILAVTPAGDPTIALTEEPQRQPQRHADARLPDRGSLWLGRRAGRLRSVRTIPGPAPRTLAEPPQAALETAGHRQRRGRRPRRRSISPSTLGRARR